MRPFARHGDGISTESEFLRTLIVFLGKAFIINTLPPCILAAYSPLPVAFPVSASPANSGALLRFSLISHAFAKVLPWDAFALMRRKKSGSTMRVLASL
ncbi:MAG: hypothetical protein LBQ75_09680 [Zoogloeaceae bacterium]|jgi:hypothetical protein|nr:hypothetical protein [Zoogloeaceae bacterium]